MDFQILVLIVTVGTVFSCQQFSNNCRNCTLHNCEYLVSGKGVSLCVIDAESHDNYKVVIDHPSGCVHAEKVEERWLNRRPERKTTRKPVMTTPKHPVIFTPTPIQPWPVISTSTTKRPTIATVIPETQSEVTTPKPVITTAKPVPRVIPGKNTPVSIRTTSRPTSKNPITAATPVISATQSAVTTPTVVISTKKPVSTVITTKKTPVFISSTTRLINPQPTVAAATEIHTTKIPVKVSLQTTSSPKRSPPSLLNNDEVEEVIAPHASQNQRCDCINASNSTLKHFPLNQNYSVATTQAFGGKLLFWDVPLIFNSLPESMDCLKVCHKVFHTEYPVGQFLKVIKLYFFF